MRRTITLDECEAIAAPAPLNRPTAVLTDRGHAAVAGYRFVRALRELPAQERAETLAAFAEELRAVIAEIAYGA